MACQRFLSAVMMMFALVGAAGCGGEPLVGRWEGDSGDDDHPNEMTLNDDLSGDATIYFAIDGENYKVDFQIRATETDGGYDIDFECDEDGDCSEVDFTMECTLGGDDDSMDCEGDEMWKEYEFEWKKEA